MAPTKTRQCKDGSLAYLIEVRAKRNGQIVHRESRTFDRQTQAQGSGEVSREYIWSTFDGSQQDKQYPIFWKVRDRQDDGVVAAQQGHPNSVNAM